MPVSQFGAALLRGMGWKKGEAIGGVNKGLVNKILTVLYGYVSTSNVANKYSFYSSARAFSLV